MDKVLIGEDFLKKTNWQRKTYPLKLNLTDIQQSRIDNLIFEYKKCINKAIDIILNKFFKEHLTQIVKEDYKKGICPLCQKEKTLSFILKDFKFELYRETKKGKNYKPVYKDGHREFICESCHCSHYSLRKFLLPSSVKNIPLPEWDYTIEGKLSQKKLERGFGFREGIYDSCLQKAVECIKSQVEIKKKLKYQINWHKKKIQENTIELNVEQKKSIKDHDEIRKLKNYINFSKRTIPKLEKRFTDKINYKQNVIRLYENSYKIIYDEGDYFIKLKDYSKNNFMTLSFFGKKYQKKMAKKFIDSKNAETEIMNKNENYYLQYIYRKQVEIPVPDKTFTAVGIDVNIINLACSVVMKNDLKPISSTFYSGRKMRFKRKRFKQMRAIWNSKIKQRNKGGKGKSRKWFKDKVESQNEQLYVKYVIHNLTTSIVQNIKDNVTKPVIVLENLKDIRLRIGKDLKIQKCSIEQLDKKQQKAIRGEKLLNSELNNWNFADFQKFLEYKANWLGIPVVYVSPKDTSIKCNKCGNIEKENYKDYHQVLFKCKKCNYECNADFNAGVNIARTFYDTIKTTKKKK